MPGICKLAGVTLVLCVVLFAQIRRVSADSDGVGGLGLGVSLGAPTGISARYYFSPRQALDLGLGATFAGKEGLHAHVAYSWLLVVLARPQKFDVGLFGGLGGRLLQHDRRDLEDNTHLGARAPLTAVFDFGRSGVPLDAFAEIAAIFDLVIGNTERVGRFDMDLNLSVGARYYF